MAPSVSFAEPNFEPGALFNLMAIVTTTALPATPLNEEELRRYIVAPSPTMRARTRSGLFSGWAGSISRMFGGKTPPPPGGRGRGNQSGSGPEAQQAMLLPWWAILPLALLALLLALAGLERKYGTVSPLFRRAADTFDRAYDAVRNWFVFPDKVNAGDLIAGLVLLALAIFLIATYYLGIYTEAVRILTHFSRPKSAGLAIWFITAMALVGFFVHLCSNFEGRQRYSGGLYMARIVLICIGVILALLNAGLYFETFRRTAGGITPPLAAIGFFAIAAVEASWFYWITQLTYPNLAALAPRLIPLPLLGASSGCRAVQRAFEIVPKSKPGPEDDPGKKEDADEDRQK